MQLPEDKMKHLVAGIAISAVAIALTSVPALGFLFAVLAGVLKEIYDDKLDYMDICWTAFGGLISTILLWWMIL